MLLSLAFGGDAVQNYLGNRAEFVRQEEQNGTGHAVKMDSTSAWRL